MMNSGVPEKPSDPTWFSTFVGEQKSTEGSTDTQPTVNTQNIFAFLRSHYRPWTEFFSTSKFKLPAASILVNRIKNNGNIFLSNYLCVFAVLLIYCILTSFVMLLTLVALGGLIYTIRQRTAKGPLVIGGQEIPPSLLYTLAIIISIPLFVLADAGQVMYWVIGSSIFVIFLHSAFYQSEEIPGAEFEVVTVSP